MCLFYKKNYRQECLCYVMKKILFLSIILISSFTLSAQNLNQLSDEQLAEYLINQSCTVDSGNALKTTLRSEKVRNVEPLLIQAYEKGPSKAELDAFEKSCRKRFDMIKKALDSGRNYGLSEEDLALVRGRTWEDFYKKEKENYVMSRRSQALLALGRTGGTEAKKFLQKEANNTKSPLQKSAKAALKLVNE